MSVTAKDIKDSFAEFAGLSDQLVERFLAQAQRRVSTTQWGDKADDGVLWLTGHLLKVESQIRSGSSAAAGPISQKSVGDLSVSYAVPSDIRNNFLASTTYGQQFIELKRLIFPSRIIGEYSTE